MKSLEYEPGDVIMRQGEQSDYVYRITSGEVEVFSEVEGQTVVLGSVKAGELLGEMGIIEGQPRSASARAKVHVTAMLLERWEFFRLMSEESSSAFRLIARLSDRLRSVNTRLAEATVSRPVHTYTIEDAPSPVESASLPALAGHTNTSGEPSLTLLPASGQEGSAVPKDGVAVSKLPFTVGRLLRPNEPTPTVPIDLSLPDTPPFRLSRQHFSLARRPDGYVVLDLGSTLGTEVNGEFLGHHFGKDFKYLDKGENIITAGGVDSPFAFKVLIDEG